MAIPEKETFRLAPFVTQIYDIQTISILTLKNLRSNNHILETILSHLIIYFQHVHYKEPKK